MSKIDKIIKWLLIFITIIFVFYTLFWVLVTFTIAHKLEKEYSGKKIILSNDYSIYFSKVNSRGFPFKFMLEFVGFKEESSGSLITHREPLRVGYDILDQQIFSEYSGESISQYKPLETGFGARIEGSYFMHAKIPINITLLEVLTRQAPSIELLNFINNFHIKSKDVHIYDLVDDSMIIADADLDAKLSIDHHEYYENIEEFLSDIPNDYHFSLSATTKDAAPGRRAIPFSIVYWTYLPTDFEYDIDIDFHTDAKKFSQKDILDNFTLKTNKMRFYSKKESTDSNLILSKKEDPNKGQEIKLEYSTKLKLGPEFNEYIAAFIDAIIKNIPKNSPLTIVKYYLNKINVGNIDLNTGDDVIDFAFNVSALRQQDKMHVTLPILSIFAKDKGIEFAGNFNNNFGTEWFTGTFQIPHLEEVINYLVKSYFKIIKSHNSPIIMHDQFWADFYIDYLKSIANNYDQESDHASIEFKLNKDVEKTKWGRYTAPESNLLYYRKLYQHLKPYTSSKSERIGLFRKMVPGNIDNPEILEKVTKE